MLKCSFLIRTYLIIFFIGGQSVFAAPDLAPPLAKQTPKTLTIHQDSRQDPYYWLNDKKNPEVIAYLEAENNYTQAHMQDTEKLQKKLYEELVNYMIETDQSVPEKRGDFYYYQRLEKGKNYPIYCRKQGSMQASEEILLDLNQLSQDQDYLALGVYEVSPNQRFLAYSLDQSGAESYTLYIKDLSTGKLLEEKIDNTYYSVKWANNSQTLYYSVIDDANRPYKLFRHQLGTPVAQDQELMHEKDESYNLSIYKTNSRKYLIVLLESITTSEAYFLDANDPQAKPKLIAKRKPNRLYNVEHHDQDFLIHTNDQALNFKLAKAPIHQPESQNWQTLVPSRQGAKLESIEVFKDYIALVYRTDARQAISILEFKTGKITEVKLPEKIATVWPNSHQIFEANQLRFSYSSLLTPWSVFDYHLPSQTLELKKQDQIQDYDPARYTMERVYAPSHDGKMVPLTLIYKKGLQRNGKNPVHLYSYGSYGSSMDADFATHRLPLLERGFVYAIAHIRGGEDLGREWYLDGKLLKKKNTFYDFIACAEYLVQHGYTAPKHLSIEGGSAGGLLMGAVTNLRPDLFQSVIADVPFVDSLTTMLDPTLPLTVIEYDEWGNPNQKPYYEYMKSYSPYDNIAAKAYPNMLVIGGLNDPRVGYWEPAKFVAKLRQTKTDQNLLLLKTHMNAGHSGSSGRYEYLKDIAFSYAFVIKMLGLNH